MRAARLALLLAAVALTLWPAAAAPQGLVVYDDFSSGEIDPTRWTGYDHRISYTRQRAKPYNGNRDDVVSSDVPDSFTAYNEEAIQQVVDGQAQIALTTVGPNFRDSDFTAGFGRSGLRVNHLALADGAPPVTRMQATVTVGAVSVDLCGGRDPAREGGSAEIFGHFFNDGSSTGPADLTGDVVVSLGRRGGSSGGVFVGVIGRCLTADCGWIGSLGSVQFTRPAALGVAYTLTITWQPTVNAFQFAVSGAGAPIESHRATYPVADSAPARGYAYDLRVANFPITCWGPPESRFMERWSIDARFDNVRFDSTAVAATR